MVFYLYLMGLRYGYYKLCASYAKHKYDIISVSYEKDVFLFLRQDFKNLMLI